MNPPDGLTRSIWTDAATPDPSLPQAGGHVEIAVIGAGIAGVTAAYLLAKEGRDVALVDEFGVDGGQTGRTSAHLASVCDDRFSHLEHLLGRNAARTFYESHASAIDRIESIVNAEKIDCDFARLDAYLFPAPSDEKTIAQEFEAAKRIDFPGVERVDAVPSVSGVNDAIRWPHQARFEPVKYVNALAASARREGVSLLVGKRVTDATGSLNGQPCKITFADGSTMTADSVVIATNVPSPINDWLGVYTKQAAYRTYIVGLEVADGAVADALYWDTLDPYHYVRLHKANGKTVLLVGGEDHKTGQAGTEAARFDALERWARQTFDGVGERVIEWSGQVNEPGDGVAFIGKAPTKGDRVYVITGDSGMGLTHGTLGAMLVTDLIAGRENLWTTLYDPNRKQTNTEFVKEQANVAKQYVDLVTPGEVSSEAEVPAGSGAVMRSGLSKVAIYKDEHGVVSKCSAVCTHLQCIVHWNGVEKSWDCSCHGSRFDPRGKVLIGPAIDDLPPVE